MPTSTTDPGERILDVTIDDDSLTLHLADGRAISAPLTWYPRLNRAAPATRQNWELCAAGLGVHWPELDEDISSAGMLQGQPTRRRTA